MLSAQPSRALAAMYFYRCAVCATLEKVPCSNSRISCSSVPECARRQKCAQALIAAALITLYGEPTPARDSVHFGCFLSELSRKIQSPASRRVGLLSVKFRCRRCCSIFNKRGHEFGNAMVYRQTQSPFRDAVSTVSVLRDPSWYILTGVCDQIRAKSEPGEPTRHLPELRTPARLYKIPEPSTENLAIFCESWTTRFTRTRFGSACTKEQDNT